MAKIVWSSEKDKYEAIGFLAREGVVTNIEANVPTKFIERFKERFKGKYIGKPYDIGSKKGGDQYRITLSHLEGCPQFLKEHVDGKTKRRINDTNFIRELVDDFGFVFTASAQNSDLIRSIVEQMGDEKYSWFKTSFYPNETFIRQLVEASDETENVVVKEYAGTDKLQQISPKKSKKKKGKKGFSNIKSNYSEEQLQKIGWIGEHYFYELLKNKNPEIYKKLNLEVTTEVEVEWFNKGFELKEDWKDKSVGKGCDMYVIANGNKLFIEIKSSRKRSRLFNMTQKEILQMKKHSEDYYLVKINYLEHLLEKKEVEVCICSDPYSVFFNPEHIKSVTFEMDGDLDE